MICNVALLVPNILEFHPKIGVMYPMSIALGTCASYVFLFMNASLQIKLADRDVVGFQMVGNHWLYRYHGMRSVLIYYDKIADFVAFALLVVYFDSALDWDICLFIYIILRLISQALCCNTMLYGRNPDSSVPSSFCVLFFSSLCTYIQDKQTLPYTFFVHI